MIEKELQELYPRWYDSHYRNPALNREMSQAIQPWVDQAIIAAGGDTQNTALRAKANMMALGYLKNYDPNKSNMKNFIYAQMRGLNRVIGNDKNIIQIPERVALGRQELSAAEKDLTDELGRFPSTQELADRTGIPMKQIAKLRRANVPMSESAFNAMAENQDMYAGGKMLGKDQAEEAWQEYVYDSLPDRSRAVMERIYGMHGYKPMKPADIASKLKITQAAVSQHRKKIDSLLNDDARYSLFGD